MKNLLTRKDEYEKTDKKYTTICRPYVRICASYSSIELFRMMF